jgi:hypothetical protein
MLGLAWQVMAQGQDSRHPVRLRSNTNTRSAHPGHNGKPACLPGSFRGGPMATSSTRPAALSMEHSSPDYLRARPLARLELWILAR